MNRSNTKPGVRDGSGRYLRGPRINSLSITRKRPDSDSQAQTHLNIRSTYKFHLNSYEISHKFQGKRAFSEAPHESIKIQASMKSTRIVLMQRLAMSEYPTNTNGQQSEKKKKKTPFCSLEKAEIFCKLLTVKKSPMWGRKNTTSCRWQLCAKHLLPHRHMANTITTSQKSSM